MKSVTISDLMDMANRHSWRDTLAAHEGAIIARDTAKEGN